MFEKISLTVTHHIKTKMFVGVDFSHHNKFFITLCDKQNIMSILENEHKNLIAENH